MEKISSSTSFSNGIPSVKTAIFRTLKVGVVPFRGESCTVGLLTAGENGMPKLGYQKWYNPENERTSPEKGPFQKGKKNQSSKHHFSAAMLLYGGGG